MKYLLLFTIALLFPACGGAPMAESIIPPRDRTPPVLMDYAVDGSGDMVIRFDEPVTVDAETAVREPSGGIGVSGGEDGSVRLSFLPPCGPGSRNVLHLDVCDKRGNTNWFLMEFYAPNGNQPGILINEVSPNGSSSRPDMVEFYVLSGGNCAGLSLLVGTESHWKERYLFPDMDVETGEYIIFHCRPLGEKGEISETGGDLNLSSGLRSEEGVRDLWPAEDMSLPSTNGILSLMSLPVKGTVLDRIVYTNRSEKETEKYAGWTAVLWPQIEELSAMGESRRGWYMAEDFLYPSDGVPSNKATSTRTLCRSSSSGDCDSREDWHTAPTGGSSFGYANTDDAYEP